MTLTDRKFVCLSSRIWRHRYTGNEDGSLSPMVIAFIAKINKEFAERHFFERYETMRKHCSKTLFASKLTQFCLLSFFCFPFALFDTYYMHVLHIADEVK